MRFKFLSIFLICLIIFSTVGAASAITTDNNQEIKDNNSVIVVNNLTVDGIEDAVDKTQDDDTILINGSVKEKGDILSKKDLHVVGQNCVLRGVNWFQSSSVVEFRNITFSEKIAGTL